MNEPLFVACTAGLEQPLADELVSLGLEAKPARGGCDASGDFVVANVHSRLASQVWWRVGTASSLRGLTSLELRKRLGDGPIQLSVTTTGKVTPPPEVWRNELTKAFRLGKEGLELMLRLDGSTGSLFADTSGDLLYKRGARQETGKAPLRETLAAGVLRLADWKPGEPLWDVMCGSGTILIEAAELCAGLAAGRSRTFAFETFPGFSPTRGSSPQPIKTWLRGSDLNAGALGVARRNARRAGVGELLQLERLDATKLERPAEVAPGLIVANLPYGKRVGNRFELDALYRALGQTLRRSFTGWRFAFLLADGDASLGLPIVKRTPVSNGGLSCSVVSGVVGVP